MQSFQRYTSFLGGVRGQEQNIKQLKYTQHKPHFPYNTASTKGFHMLFPRPSNQKLCTPLVYFYSKLVHAKK